MTFKKFIRNLIIGKDVYIESKNEFRQVMLSGQYALVALFAIVYYFILAIQCNFFAPNLIYGVSASVIVLSIVMHRYGKHCTANILLFPTLNILLFLIVSSEDVGTGGYLFFFPLAIGSSAVFNYSRRSYAVFFIVLSLFLLIMSISGSFSGLPFRHYPPSIVQMAFQRNIIFSFCLSVVSVYLLISLNHHISKQLVASYQQTKNLNEELDRFVYSTSHDLRAPISSVLGLLELTEAASENGEKQKYHRLIKSRLSKLDHLITDLTNYSRNKRLQIVKEDVFLRELSDDVWDSLRYQPQAMGIEFVNEIPHNLIVKNDGTRLRVVLTNIISNAIRYHQSRGDRQYIRLYHEQTPSSFSIHIEDNGQGIAPEQHHKIFDMFYRANESSQGSGLGLYIVKETLATLSGTIQFTSNPKQGSTFSILMPSIE